ncbi:unnamed protein product, partial [Heterosigma akashiwo]
RQIDPSFLQATNCLAVRAPFAVSVRPRLTQSKMESKSRTRCMAFVVVGLALNSMAFGFQSVQPSGRPRGSCTATWTAWTRA